MGRIPSPGWAGELAGLFEGGPGRGGRLLGAIVLAEAPRGLPGPVLEVFRARVEAVLRAVGALERGRARALKAAADALVGEVHAGLRDLAGGIAAARVVLEATLVPRAELVELEPENTGFLRDLSVSYERMGDLDLRVDPARARAWFEQDLQIARKLVELEPDNRGFLRDVAVSHDKLWAWAREHAPAEEPAQRTLLVAWLTSPQAACVLQEQVFADLLARLQRMPG